MRRMKKDPVVHTQVRCHSLRSVGLLFRIPTPKHTTGPVANSVASTRHTARSAYRSALQMRRIPGRNYKCGNELKTSALEPPQSSRTALPLHSDVHSVGRNGVECR